ncbi:MAG TPA: LCP family protein [Sedimentibacter sp.]|nr:LCP family protein [Sedimentibacter sp.]HQB63472.1 LCP family protein [Sedimentibacter sp.]
MIKHFIKIFFASLLLISVVLSFTALGYIFLVDKDIAIGKIEFGNDEKNGFAFYESSTFDYGTSLGKAASNMKRFNILLAGLENKRTDTIMLVSYDTENKTADIISLPRDTYLPRNTDDEAELKKINAVYGQEGIEGLTLRVQGLLGIPVEKYAVIDYEAVVACVDMIGGVQVDVPFHMEYTDIYDDPPLYIDIPEGVQVLDGEQSLKFLRFRKGYDNQDLGRIEAQQQFIKSFVKRSLGLQLPEVIKEAYSHIETNISVSDLLDLAGDLVGFSTDNINTCILPGMETPLEGLSFYIPDENGIKNLIYSLYGLEISNN